MPKAATVTVSVSAWQLHHIANWLGRQVSETVQTGGLLEVAHDSEIKELIVALRQKFDKAANRKRSLHSAGSYTSIDGLQIRAPIQEVNIAIARTEAEWLATRVRRPSMFGYAAQKLAIASLPLPVRDLCEQCRHKVRKGRGRPRLMGSDLKNTAEGSGPALSNRQHWRRRSRWRAEKHIWDSEPATDTVAVLMQSLGLKIS